MERSDWSQTSLVDDHINPSNAEATFPQGKDFFENRLNPVMLVFIEKLLLSTLIWVPICQGFNHFQFFLHHCVLAKLATSSIRVKGIKGFGDPPLQNIDLLAKNCQWLHLKSVFLPTKDESYFHVYIFPQVRPGCFRGQCYGRDREIHSTNSTVGRKIHGQRYKQVSRQI